MREYLSRLQLGKGQGFLPLFVSFDIGGHAQAPHDEGAGEEVEE